MNVSLIVFYALAVLVPITLIWKLKGKDRKIEPGDVVPEEPERLCLVGNYVIEHRPGTVRPYYLYEIRGVLNSGVAFDCSTKQEAMDLICHIQAMGEESK